MIPLKTWCIEGGELTIKATLFSIHWRKTKTCPLSRHLSQESSRLETARFALRRVHLDSNSAESMPSVERFDIANAVIAGIRGRKKAIDFPSLYNCNCIAI
jgi:hypothetical protein